MNDVRPFPAASARDAHDDRIQDAADQIVARVRAGESLEFASANVRAALTLGGLTWLVAVRRARGTLEGEGDL